MIDIATGQKLTAILRKRPRRAYQAMLGQGLVNQAIYFRLFLACLRTKRELCSLYVLKQGGGDVEGFCRGSSGFGVDRAVCRDDRDMGPSNSQSVIPNL
jgi:hypothetical protein